jgi:hypothetical protein
VSSTYIIAAGITIFLIGIYAVAWGNSTAGECNNFTGPLTQLIHNERGQCAYRGESIGIGIVFLVIGIVLIIFGANPKEKQQAVH